jgi:hypothetical protein
LPLAAFELAVTRNTLAISEHFPLPGV